MAVNSTIHQTLARPPMVPGGHVFPDGTAMSKAQADFHAEMEFLIGTHGEGTALDYFQRLELQAQRNPAPVNAVSSDTPDTEKPSIAAENDVTKTETAQETAQESEKATAEAPDKTEEELTFWDALDVINPLQHIPLVNILYREITGDEIKPAAKIAGGALFGGGIGLISAIGDTMLEEFSGKTISGHALAMIKPDDAAPSSTMLANQEKLYKTTPDGPMTSPSATASDFDELI